jgi:hypothetical protein
MSKKDAPNEVQFVAALQTKGCIKFDSDGAAYITLGCAASEAPKLAILAMAFTEQELQVTIRRQP